MARIFEKILCPVDFDRNRGSAIKFACEFAEPFRSTVYLLHVLSIPRMEPIALEPGPVFTQAVAERELENLARQNLASNVRYQVLVRSGEPAATIIAVASELNADLIVMPTHGHTGIARMILGSVAERVVREATKPVVTIRP
jgi:nucleotide-binding universal stress UspA family protein